MRTSALVRVTAAVTASLLGLTVLGTSPSYADEPALPVVVGDTVSLYPGQVSEINVLANDSSPDGDDLALCRFPDPGTAGNDVSSILVMNMGPMGDPGDVTVVVPTGAHGTHVVDYYVCDHTHLVPARLTVEIKAVAPVKVRKVAGKPGRLKVTNKNAEAIRFWYGHPRAQDPDGKVRIPAGATRTVSVRRHTILWIALIGGGHGKAAQADSAGLADQGVVRGIKLRPGTELTPPRKLSRPTERPSAYAGPGWRR